MEEIVQANVFLTISNSEVIMQLEQMTATMNSIQVKLKTLFAISTNPTIPNRK